METSTLHHDAPTSSTATGSWENGSGDAQANKPTTSGVGSGACPRPSVSMTSADSSAHSGSLAAMIPAGFGMSISTSLMTMTDVPRCSR
ncbi:hypothetical protein Nepgr_014204 [Nepenthes gracilis]|uniref:Uncharacterized protein n=1 Tax=Nepenthes gracilis TaxID=150966 RepID=A0AAD3SJ21_NEPGR|nr:hypothetical protein Nepgr_014204 [Nepenthes gracilis]